jgi:hypothetical protein
MVCPLSAERDAVARLLRWRAAEGQPVAHDAAFSVKDADAGVVVRMRCVHRRATSEQGQGEAHGGDLGGDTAAAGADWA